MTLPVFDIPKYKTKIPSTQETVEFRPFLVKEQKILLMAANGDSELQIDAIENINDACTFNKLNVKKLSSFDNEYLFLQIRSMSMGENIELSLNCSCGYNSSAKLDLTTVQVKKDSNHTNNIDLGSGIIVKMRYPRLREVEDISNNKEIENIIHLIASSIESIWKGDTFYSSEDYSLEELISFVENLSPENLDKLDNFFNTMPTLKHDIEWDCKECQKHNLVTLEGIQSFFN